MTYSWEAEELKRPQNLARGHGLTVAQGAFAEKIGQDIEEYTERGDVLRTVAARLRLTAQ